MSLGNRPKKARYLICLVLVGFSTYAVLSARERFLIKHFSLVDEPALTDSVKEFHYTLEPDVTAEYLAELNYKTHFEMSIPPDYKFNYYPEKSLTLEWKVVDKAATVISSGKGLPKACGWSGSETSLCIGPQFSLTAGQRYDLFLKIKSPSAFPNIKKTLRIAVSPHDFEKVAVPSTWLLIFATISLGVALVIAIRTFFEDRVSAKK